VVLNPEHIIQIRKHEEGGSFVQMVETVILHIQETPEFILGLLELR
jgi:hypothetical protein